MAALSQELRSDPHRLASLAPDFRRAPSLDGLRAISIALVVLMHFTEGLPGAPPAPGLFGVEMFFAISGFLITRLLLAELEETGRVSLANFYFRRVLRLTPALAAMTLCFSLFIAAQGARDFRATICALAYVTNYCVTGVGTMYDGPAVNLEGTWSLAVEEHFYLLFPLLLLALFRRDIRALYAAIGALCLVALGFRIFYALQGRPENFLVWRTETACDLLMGGCLLSVASAHEAGRAALRRVATTRVLALATLVFVVGELLSRHGKLAMAFSQSAIALWLATLIANVLLNPDLGGARAALNHSLAVFFGRISYSLYLWHFLVLTVGERYGLLGNYGGAAAAIVASIAIASASYLWLEQPILRRRSAWAKRLGIDRPGAALATVRPV